LSRKSLGNSSCDVKKQSYYTFILYNIQQLSCKRTKYITAHLEVKEHISMFYVAYKPQH